MTATARAHSGEFNFVQELAKDLSAGDLELPSYPDIVARIRGLLADEKCSIDQIVQVLGAEPGLAARIISISNCSALGLAADPITDLRMAVNRIGFSMVRNTTMSYGMAQTRSSYTLKDAKTVLESLWDECAHVAALCFVLAKKYTKLNPDEALLVGLMHGIGKLYILGRADSHPELFNDKDSLMSVMDQWHSAIGAAILENWGFESHMATAIENYRDYEREHADSADYTDVLTLAALFSQFVRSSNDMEVHLEEIPASKQLNIRTDDMIPIIQSSNNQINSLRRALGK